MTIELAWSDRALRRLEELGDFVAQRDPAAAARLVETLFDQVGRLADFPRMGRVFRGATTDSVREMLFGQYKVYYLLEEANPGGRPERVTILTVRHSREAPASLDAVLDDGAA